MDAERFQQFVERVFGREVPEVDVRDLGNPLYRILPVLDSRLDERVLVHPVSGCHHVKRREFAVAVHRFCR